MRDELERSYGAGLGLGPGTFFARGMANEWRREVYEETCEAIVKTTGMNKGLTVGVGREVWQVF
jgi:hypothetical protein